MVEWLPGTRQQADARIAAATHDDDRATDDDVRPPAGGEGGEARASRPRIRVDPAHEVQAGSGTASVGAGLTPWR